MGQLFNKAFERIFQNTILDTRGTIINKSVQILADANDVNIKTIIMSRTVETLINLTMVAIRMHTTTQITS